ncbi:hypothetical protein EA462_05265 [Natrarchaeobius halalkaliphilus]|uniref:Uncharacterized protein n=1 Tax=Natrarchaeobius halalkaliphilus TaxID=1679091 RepID=A0A3N6LPI4_9EURY|nr:hypothetical protein [Natrarchaeobius halalkaliphilus]RQG91383.1 hypothetical protein EA462_05265 [Natrarchaeobius halalkaliphilus]
MSIDRHAAERRRFARLLGTDGEVGSGLPIGSRSSSVSKSAREERRTDGADDERVTDFGSEGAVGADPRSE